MITAVDEEVDVIPLASLQAESKREISVQQIQPADQHVGRYQTVSAFAPGANTGDSFNVDFSDILDTVEYRRAFRKFLETDTTIAFLLDFLDAVDTMKAALKKIVERHDIMANPNDNPEPDRAILMAGPSLSHGTKVADPEASSSAAQAAMAAATILSTVSHSSRENSSQAPASQKRRKSLVQSDVATLRLTAKGYLRKYFAADCAVNVLAYVPKDVVQDLEDSSKRWVEIGKEDKDEQTIESQKIIVEAFADAEKAVRVALEEQAYPLFVQSDTYVEMMIDRMEGEDGDLEDVDRSHVKGGKGHDGWINAQGFQSIHVDVQEAKNLRDGLWGQHADAYTVVTVDSLNYKTKVLSSSSPNWGAENNGRWSHFEFPLRITTTHVVLNAFDHQLMRPDKHLGKVEIAIADALATQEETIGSLPATVNAEASDSKSKADRENRMKIVPQWYSIRKEVDEQTEAPKNRGEILVRVYMSKQPAQDTGHKPIHTDSSSVLADVIRAKVSKKKRRFRKDGFDLDLTYITDRVIAMGFPSQGTEGVYRNNLSTVKTFFEKRHKSHYRVYNLCSERTYDPKLFDDNVARYGFDDHNPCPFWMITDFCKDVHKYLTTHPQNIAAIHCKAGKGRTGLMIGAYMLHTQLFHNAVSCLKYYAARRTYNSKGVTIPSQIRYVHYFDRFLRYTRLVKRANSRLKEFSSQNLTELSKKGSMEDFIAPMNVLKDISLSKTDEQKQQNAARALGFKHRKMSVMERADVLDYLHTRNTRTLSVENQPTAHKSGSYFLPDDDKHHMFASQIVIGGGLPYSVKKGDSVFFKLSNVDTALDFNSKGKIKPKWDSESESLKFDCRGSNVLVFGDVQIVFYSSNRFGKTKLFQIWVNTRFVCADGCYVKLTKPELDKANKDVKNKSYSDSFHVELNFEMQNKLEIKELYSTLYSIQEKYDEFSNLLKEELETMDLASRQQQDEKKAVAADEVKIGIDPTANIVEVSADETSVTIPKSSEDDEIVTDEETLDDYE